MKLNNLFITLLLSKLINCFSLDVTDEDSICKGATYITNGMMDYYEGTRYGGTVGMFQSPYYWWEAGEIIGGMIDTWYFCQNDTYEQIIYDALMHQKGADNDYIPANQSLTEGNDDQALWGMAVMGAAERNFTAPGELSDSADDVDDDLGWLALAQAVYNTMWSRWDADTCGGGLRWQIFTWNSGYDYKNTISNGALFHIAARLARFTRNDTYVDTAETIWNWLTDDVGFVKLDGDLYQIYDGADISTNNCSTIDTNRWTYNYGIILAGCAYLYNYTEDTEWSDRAEKVWNGITSTFVNSSTNAIFELCQNSGQCNTDQRSFRSILSRCLGLTAVLIPDMYNDIFNVITDSAKGAAQSCSGGTDGVTCGINWSYGGWDNWYGLGEQASALEIIQNLLIKQRPAPFTSENGGTSKGDFNAGQDTGDIVTNPHAIVVTSKDKGGAGFVTALVLAILIGLAIWMIL